MKVIKIQLEDSVYEELEAMLDAIGQTKQTFYETFTKSALKEWRTLFVTKESRPAAHENNNSKMEAFMKLEASRKNISNAIDFSSKKAEANSSQINE